MPSRFEYERAVRASDLPPLSRLLAFTIATWADIKSGKIPAGLMPSLSTLEAATGMSRGAVRSHLDRLEKGGWLIRQRPTVAAARGKKARTKYGLRVPLGAAVGEDSSSPESDDLSGTGDALDKSPSGAGDALALGQEMPQLWGRRCPSSRAGDALSSSSSSLPTNHQDAATPEGGPAEDAQLAAAIEFLQSLPAPWTIGPRTAEAMAPQLLEMARLQGWQLDEELVAKLTRNPERIHSHPPVLRSRIGDLPRRQPPPAAKSQSPLPDWCGDCADGNPAAAKTGHVRLVYDDRGNGRPCPKCHPSQINQAA